MSEDRDDLPVAATVVVVRTGSSGAEVLLLKRPDTGSFAGGWVFPGGKLEPGDGDPIEDEEHAARIAGARETWEECGLRLDPEMLVPYSIWTPPVSVPVRIRTWFFLGEDPGGELVPSPREVVDAMWARPEDILERHAHGEMALFPPTWVTLHGLTGLPDATAALANARLRGIEHFATVMRRSQDGEMVLWHGDAQYDDPESVAPDRHRLLTAALPWVYTRTT